MSIDQGVDPRMRVEGNRLSHWVGIVVGSGDDEHFEVVVAAAADRFVAWCSGSGCFH